jgi:hypothetical protein
LKSDFGVNEHTVAYLHTGRRILKGKIKHYLSAKFSKIPNKSVLNFFWGKTILKEKQKKQTILKKTILKNLF